MKYLATLQSRLVAAFVLVVLVALVLAAVVFVALRRGDQEQHQLDQVAAASPALFGEFSAVSIRSRDEEALRRFVDQAADDHDVRVLLVDQTGIVAEDSGGGLLGKKLALPPPPPGDGPRDPGGPRYQTFKPAGDSPASGLILVTSALPPLRFGLGPREVGRAQEPYSLVLAVPEGTVTRAWLDLLPGLGVAAAIALPVAILLALLLARSITRPLQRLTVASQRMAEGAFDVDVPTGRSDEVGRLSQAFATMATRVGEAHSQMRQLVANVSHDLKTPLTSIVGFARALETGAASGDTDARRAGAVISEEADRLSRRLNDILYLSELDAGQTVLEPEEIDLDRLVRAVCARVLPPAEARGVRVTLALAEASVLGDASKMERAVENLLDNAAKYTPDGGDIRVALAPGGETVRLTIANSAPGLEAPEAERLFERFYRRDRARGRAAGSGLGLPIARDLVALHGGSLGATVEDGSLLLSLVLPRLPAGEGEDAESPR